MTAVIDDAVAEYEHRKFWEELRAAVERTRREDPAGWADHLAETAVFDRAAQDGLEPEDWSSHLPPKEHDADNAR